MKWIVILHIKHGNFLNDVVSVTFTLKNMSTTDMRKRQPWNSK